MASTPATGTPDERHLRVLIAGEDEVAVRRHHEGMPLESALERRAVTERAKGVVMERHGLPEREAFDRIRDQARSTGRRVADIAQAVLDGHALLPRG